MSQHPDELIIPKWMSFDFFEKMLINSIGDRSIKVEETNVVPASALGDHYASIIYRANVKYSSKSTSNADTSIIIKCMPEAEGQLKEILSQSQIFKTEIGIYTKILPEMDKLLRLAGYTDSSIAPKIMYETLDIRQIAAFEDISKLGFKPVNKTLDYSTTKLVTAKLAKFHATSYYLHYNNGNVSDFNVGMMSKNSFDPATLFSENLRVFKEEVTTWPGFEKYFDKLDVFEKIVFEKCTKLYTENKNGLNVLNHGDFHFKNLLFKYDDNGQPIDVMFVDFQICVWASPAIDLIYLLYVVASNEVREKYRRELIYFYHQEFTKVLKDLGFIGRIPNLLDFQLELLKNGFFELFFTMTILLYFYVNFKEYITDSGQLFDANLDLVAIKKQLCRTPVYMEVVKTNLPKFMHKGFF